LRDECLNIEWFPSLDEARRKLAAWRDEYNHNRPHSALDDRTPAVFAQLHTTRKSKVSVADSEGKRKVQSRTQYTASPRELAPAGR
jgi:hypothetical protein